MSFPHHTSGPGGRDESGNRILSKFYGNQLIVIARSEATKQSNIIIFSFEIASPSARNDISLITMKF